MRRIILTTICVLLVVGAMPALAQEESETVPPPPEQTDQAAAEDELGDGAWQYDDEDAEEGENFVFAHGDSHANAAAGIAAAGGLAMVGFAMLGFILYFGFIMFIMASSMAVLVATVLAIYDCARRDFPDPNTRALWCILIVLTRWMGALIYYISVYRANDPPLAAAVATRPTTTPQT